MRSSVRERRLHIRMSEEEHTELSAKAEAAGMSLSAFLRDHASRAFVRHRDDERKRLGMLNRINANLNMISKWANTYKAGAESVDIMVHLADVERSIMRLLAAMDRVR